MKRKKVEMKKKIKKIGMKEVQVQMKKEVKVKVMVKIERQKEEEECKEKGEEIKQIEEI